MSATEEKELKGGHPPAVKAGGMRVSRKRTDSSGEPAKPETNNMTKEEEEEFGSSPPKTDAAHNQQVLISGAVGKGDQDFSAQAVKQYHDKPIPSKENRPVQQRHNIQQPR